MNSNPTFALLETWTDANIKTAFDQMKKDKATKEAAKLRYQPIYEAFGLKTLNGIKGIVNKWSKVDRVVRFEVLKKWPRDIPFIPVDTLDLSVNWSDPNHIPDDRLTEKDIEQLGNLSFLQHIKILNLQWNNLDYVPDNLKDMTGLEYLFLQSNHLNILPDYWDSFPNLKHLNLEMNISMEDKFPPSFFTLSNLKKFHYSNTPLDSTENTIVLQKHLPNCILDCSSLSALKAQEKMEKTNLEVVDNTVRIRYKKLFQLPQAIYQIENLEKIDASSNRITSIAKEIAWLKNLKVLHLNDNQLEELPPEICELKQLEILSLEDNRIERLPENMGQLTQLKELNLKDTRIKVFPKSFGELKKLEKLYVSAHEASVEGSLSCMMGLKELTFEDYHAFASETAWTTLPNLETLQFGNSGSNKSDKLVSHLADIASLKKLEIKNVSGSPTIFDGLKRLQNLEILNLRGLKTTEFPEDILELKALKELYVRGGIYPTLPKTFFELRNLKKLYCYEGALERLDENIGQLTQLENIRLSRNVLQTLPESINQLQNLKRLNLQENNIETLPDSIFELQNLQKLLLFGNPITQDKSFIGKLRRKLKNCSVEVKEDNWW